MQLCKNKLSNGPLARASERVLLPSNGGSVNLVKVTAANQQRRLGLKLGLEIGENVI